MSQITINIPDPETTRVITDISNYFNYQPFLIDFLGGQTPNPETRAQFAKRMIIETMKGWCRAIEGGSAADSARSTAEGNVNAIGIN